MVGIRPEFGALYGPNKSIRAGENLFAWIRLFFRSRRFPSFAMLMHGNLVTSNIKRRFGVRISYSRAVSQPVNFA